MVGRYPNNWVQVQKCLPGRTKTQIYSYWARHKKLRDAAARKEMELARPAKVGRPKNPSLDAEKELKDMVRPLIFTARKRQRCVSLPGDGREHGLIQACLFRILDCKLSKFPSPDALDDHLEEQGIEEQDVAPFRVLRSLIDEMRDQDPSQDSSSAANEPNDDCLPATLSTLVGFRGLLRHAEHLETTAAMPYDLPEAASDADDGGDLADAALMRRTLALFFWPAIMSSCSIPPELQQPAEPSTLKRKPARPPRGQPGAKKQKCA